MTAIDPRQALPDPRLAIPCEWEDAPCQKNAVAMIMACADDKPAAICLEHLMIQYQWFGSRTKFDMCVCGRPFHLFETHYKVIPLD